jgi:hypothetical protein
MLALAASGCQALRPLRRLFSQPVPVTVVAGTPAAGAPARPTIPACTPLLPGMALTVTTEALAESTAIVVEISGLQPGELPVFAYDPGTPGGRVEVTPGQRVGADGRAVDKTVQLPMGLFPPTLTYQIQVVHAGGAACTQFTTP